MSYDPYSSWSCLGCSFVISPLFKPYLPELSSGYLSCWLQPIFCYLCCSLVRGHCPVDMLLVFGNVPTIARLMWTSDTDNTTIWSHWHDKVTLEMDIFDHTIGVENRNVWWDWHDNVTLAMALWSYWHSLIMLARIPSSSWLPWHDNVTLAMTLRSYWLGNVILAMELPPVLFSNSIINWLYKYNTRLYSKYNHGHMYNKLLKCKSSFCSTYTAQTPWWNYLPWCLDSIHYLWP